jgi:hypothetical protein
MAVLADCAPVAGNIKSNIGLTSDLPAPAPLPEPSFPPAFPPVSLLWQQTLYPDRGLSGRSMIAAKSTVGRRTAKLDTAAQRSPKDRAPDADLLAMSTAVESSSPEPVSLASRPPEPASKSFLTPRPDVEDILRLGGIIVPFLHADASEAERHFQQQATNAVEKVFVEDYDDPSVLLSLYEKMTTDKQLSYMQKEWGEPLEKAIAHAETLQRVASAIQAIRRSFEHAAPSGQANLFNDVDQAQCRPAFTELRDRDSSALDLYITVSPIGHYTLAELESICQESHRAELKARHFPKEEGPPYLRKLVRRAYNRAYHGRKVRKVVVLQGGWQVHEDDKRRVLRAIVGVKRQRGFGKDPCVMEEITLVQEEKRQGRYGASICCQIQSSVAIDCKELK